MKLLKSVLFAAGVFTATPAFAQSEVAVKFPPGKSGTEISGTIKGDSFIDYKVGANAGQKIDVSLTSKNASLYFNLLEPGSADEAIFVGSISGGEYKGALAKSGDYTIRVYLMRNAARRGETADYDLDIEID